MYSENSYKNYIFWLKIRQIVIIIGLSLFGCIVGRYIGSFLVDILMFKTLAYNISVIVTTLIFLCIALMATANTARDVQDAYWKIAVLRKLTVISKKLDNVSDETKKEIKSAIDDLEIEPEVEREKPKTKSKTKAKASTKKEKKVEKEKLEQIVNEDVNEILESN